jgi:hypothetical protein
MTAFIQVTAEHLGGLVYIECGSIATVRNVRAPEDPNINCYIKLKDERTIECKESYSMVCQLIDNALTQARQLTVPKEITLRHTSP